MPTNAPLSRSSWPSDLRDYAEQLGSPDTIFTTANGRIRHEAKIGITLLLIGFAFHTLYWFVLNQPDWPLKLVVIFGGLVPALGLLSLLLVWLNRGLWVLVYPTGVLLWKRGVITTFPWEEISSISFAGVLTFADPVIERDEDDRIQSAWLPVQRSTGFRWRLLLHRNDGVTKAIPEHLGNSAGFSQLIQERIFQMLWPDIVQRLRNGEDCAFGPLRVSRAGLTDGREDLVRWEQIGSIRTDRTLQIRKVGRWHPWRTIFIPRLLNPHLLLTLIATRNEWCA